MSHSEDYQDTGRTTAFYQGVEAERKRIIELIRKTYVDTDFEEYGSFVYSEDVIELIEKSK